MAYRYASNSGISWKFQSFQSFYFCPQESKCENFIFPYFILRQVKAVENRCEQYLKSRTIRAGMKLTALQVKSFFAAFPEAI